MHLLASIKDELQRISHSPWDLLMVAVVPLCLLLLFGSIFLSGKPEHLDVGVVDEDKSQFSQTIIHHIAHNQSLAPIRQINTHTAHNAINDLSIGGFLYIPKGAETRLVNGDDTGMYIATNQSFYSTGNNVSGALNRSVQSAALAYLTHDHARNLLPNSDLRTPKVKLSILFNPNLSYELFLEPFVVIASLHLLLCCLVAFSLGALLHKTPTPSLSAIWASVLVYVLIICLWTWLWQAWLINVRGVGVVGSGLLLIVAQVLLYSAYALLAATVVLRTKSASKSFGILAVYGGSSLSFAGISLPLNNATAFTQVWSNLLPFTHFARLQTEQWLMGSPLAVSLPHLGILVLFNVLFGTMAILLHKKILTP